MSEVKSNVSYECKKCGVKVTLVLTPFVGIMETFGVFIAPLQLHKFERTPTPKSAERETENLVFSTIIQQPCQEELIL